MTEPADLPPDFDPDFDEAAYLKLYPDIAAAVSSGKRRSGLEHYLRYGRAEGRHFVGRRDGWTEVRLGASAGLEGGPAAAPRHAIETVLLSESGRLFITGWFDDSRTRLAALRVEGRGWVVRLQSEALSRTSRADVEASLGRTERGALGFFALLNAGSPLAVSADCRCVLEWESAQPAAKTAPIRVVTWAELREIVLGYVTAAASGGSQVPAMLALDAMAGEQIVSLNRAITEQITAAPFVERFGSPTRNCKGSIIICLYGRPEYLAIQNALFTRKPGIEDYEFIYICNSPELLERLLKEARASALIYGLGQTVVGLPANAGFAAANNAAARLARGRRILCVNPDVFPKDPAWAARHTGIVEAGGPGSRLFGATLFYDDGSLMHGGMYLELDTGLAIRGDRLETRRFARVEHYGKGAPPDAEAYLRPRPVPAVSGAFLSVERDWFERLGGFSEDYVLGHYEDADFCLRSLAAGVPAWVQDVRLWHLEGRGSVRQAVHEGANIVNRWLFSRRWAELIGTDLCGPAPRRDLLAGVPPPPSAATQRDAEDMSAIEIVSVPTPA
ncbi:MAG: hypothetical protein WBQ75_14040 [Acetobacteraceae bacterium]